MSSASADTGRTLLFVYGTLKQGFPNGHEIPKGTVYLGKAQTAQPYPLVIGTKIAVPFMLDQPGHSRAHHVQGELYSANDTGMQVLDIFENIPLRLYRRERLDVMLTEQSHGKDGAAHCVSGESVAAGTILSATCYFRYDGGPEWALEWPEDRLEKLEMVAEYTKEHASRYIPRNER